MDYVRSRLYGLAMPDPDATIVIDGLCYEPLSMIAAAGELASELGLTGWDNGEATRAVVRCFSDWLSARETIDDQDMERAIQQVMALLERFGNYAHFDDCRKSADSWDTARDRYGFCKEPEKDVDGNPIRQFLILPSVWKNRFCKGYDATAVAREMIARCMMEPGKGKNPSKTVDCGRHGKQRVYPLKPGVGTEQVADTRTAEQKRQDFNAWMMSENPEDARMVFGQTDVRRACRPNGAAAESELAA